MLVDMKINQVRSRLILDKLHAVLNNWSEIIFLISLKRYLNTLKWNFLEKNPCLILCVRVVLVTLAHIIKTEGCCFFLQLGIWLLFSYYFHKGPFFNQSEANLSQLQIFAWCCAWLFRYSVNLPWLRLDVITKIIIIIIIKFLGLYSL